MRSDTIKRGLERAPHRSLLRATGQSRDEADFGKPFITLCNSYVDIIPGHPHLQEFGRMVKGAGAYLAPGVLLGNLRLLLNTN